MCLMFLKFVFRSLSPGNNKYKKNDFLHEDKAETGALCLKAKERQTLGAAATGWEEGTGSTAAHPQVPIFGTNQDVLQQVDA